MAARYSDKIDLYLKDNSTSLSAEQANIILQDDGSGPYIHTWNVSGVAKPSESKLNEYNTAAENFAAGEKIKNKRKRSYGSWNSQFDLLYHDLVSGKLDATGEWAKAVKKVKDDNPKS